MANLLLAALILGLGMAYFTHAIPVHVLQAHGDQKDRAIFVVAISVMLVLIAIQIIDMVS